jgi:hypothetical protein
MALTIASKEVLSLGNRRGVLITVTGTNAAGGFAVTPASFGLQKIDAFLPEGEEGGRYLVYDRTAGKVSFYDDASGEDTSTDTTSKGIRALVVGY